MLKQKILAILIVTSTMPIYLLGNDATATVLSLFVAIPLFFAKKRYI